MSAEEKWRVFHSEILHIMYAHDTWASGLVLVEKSNGEGIRHEMRQQPKTEEEMFQIRRQCNQALLDACNRHRREFAMMAGEPIEPQVHYGTATVQAVAGA